MSTRNPVYRETAAIAIGEVLCVGLMLGIYALAGRLDRSVVLGGMLGGLQSRCKFFLMAVGASRAADRAAPPNVAGGTALVRMSFLLRYLVLFLILFAAAKSKRFDLLALVLPLVFVRPILMLGEFFRKSGEKRS